MAFIGGNEEFAVVRDDEAKKKDRADVEYQNAPEGELDGTGDLIECLVVLPCVGLWSTYVTARILRLSHSHANQFGAQECEDCGDHA